jgi:hypothetical protein
MSLQLHTIISYAVKRLHNYSPYTYVTSHLFHSCTQSLPIDSMRLHWLTSELTVTITDYHTLLHMQSLQFTLQIHFL